MAAGPQVVVGDRFTEFLAHRGTVGAGALLMRLRSGLAADPVRFGQGLTVAQRAELAALLGPDAGVPAAVERGVTHKRADKNVLVSAPRPVGDGAWEAELVLDEDTETLSDHVTGQHVPAIALLEVARQMWTAVTETFLLPRGGPRTRFVVLAMGGEFLGYVFPLPATVRFVLADRAADGAGETFSCVVEVHQNGRPAVRMRGEYRVVPEAVAAKQESLAARRALVVAAGGAAPAVRGATMTRTFLVHCLDGPDAAPRRAELRAAHSARLAALRDAPAGVELLVYGPLVAEDGTTAVGSAFLVSAATRAEVRDRFAADPFSTGGVWATVQIHELAVSANAPVRLDPARSPS